MRTTLRGFSSSQESHLKSLQCAYTRGKRCNQISVPNFFVSILCLHTQAQSKPSPASTGNNCLLLFYKKQTNNQLTVPQNSEVSCHLCVALYDTLKLKIKFSLSYFRLYQCNWWKFVYSVYFTCTPKKLPVISIQISVVA